MTTLAEQIDAFEFDHVFTLHPDGTITEPKDVWAPDVYHDDATDVMIGGNGIYGTQWRALTGMTGQDSYHGAVMHPSEYIGRGIADYLQELASDTPATFVVVIVECLPRRRDPEPEPAGWAILHLEQP